MAGYLTFARRPGDESAKTSRPEPGFVVDYSDDDRPIGLEITSPSLVTMEAINRVLLQLEQPPATQREMSLLFATQGGSAVAAAN